MNRKLSSMLKTTFIIMLLSLVLCVSGWAESFKVGNADFTIGASLRLDSGYQNYDFGDYKAEQSSQTTFFTEVGADSNVHLNAVWEGLTAYVEAGLPTQDGSSLYLRQAYVEYTLGNGDKFLVGDSNSIFALSFPNQVLKQDIALIGNGKLWGERHPQIQYTHFADNYTVKLSIEENRGTDLGPAYGLSGPYKANTTAPLVMGQVTFNPSANVTIFPSFAIQNVSYEGDAPGVEDEDMLSWVFAFDGSIATSAAVFSGEAWYGQNVYPFSSLCSGLRPTWGTIPFGAPTVNAQGDIEDNSSYGGWVQMMVPVDKMKFQVGAGYQQAEINGLDSTLYEENISTWGAYTNVVVPIQGAFVIQPEIAYFDWGNDAEINSGANDLGSTLLVGVHFQYDF